MVYGLPNCTVIPLLYSSPLLYGLLASSHFYFHFLLESRGKRKVMCMGGGEEQRVGKAVLTFFINPSFVVMKD